MYTYRTCNGEMRGISIYYWYVCIIIYTQPLNSLFPIAKPQVESSGQAPMAPFHPAWRCTWKDNWAVLVMAILHGIDPNSYSSGTKSTKQTSRSCSSSRKKWKTYHLPSPNRKGDEASTPRLPAANTLMKFSSGVWISQKWMVKSPMKIGYIPNYSHLIGIMIINHWV